MFDADGWYVGPLPKQVPTEGLIDRVGNQFKTAASAARPPQLCEWAASVILSSFDKECKRAREEEENVFVQEADLPPSGAEGC